MGIENEEVYVARKLTKETHYTTNINIMGPSCMKYFTRIEHYNSYFRDKSKTHEVPNVHYKHYLDYISYSTSRERANFYYLHRENHIYSDFYWIEERKNRLYLKCYYGKLDNCMIKENIELDESELGDLKDDLIFIEAGPGEGKTTMLINLTKNLKIKQQKVILCFLRNYTDMLDCLKFDNMKDIETFLKHVFLREERNQNQEISWSQDEEIIIILDGFDEVSLDHRLKIEKLVEIVLEMYINKKIIISSRHGVDMKLKHEKYRFKPLTKDENVKYLQAYLRNKEKVEAILKNLDTFNSFERSICDIPLQLQMAVEIYQDQEYQSLSFLEHYENYYQKIIKDPKKLQHICQATHHHFLVKNLDNKNLFLTSIKTDGTFTAEDFGNNQCSVHNTIIEFIIAEYLAKNWKNNLNFMLQNFQNLEFGVVSYFFDLLMVQNKLLLNAIVRNNMTDITENLKFISETDELRRNALHFAVKYNRCDVLEVLLKADVQRELVAEKDKLFGKTAAQYATSDRTCWLVIDKLSKYDVPVEVLELKMKMNDKKEWEECLRTCLEEDNLKLYLLVVDNFQSDINSCYNNFIYKKLPKNISLNYLRFSHFDVACIFGSLSILQFLYQKNELCRSSINKGLYWSLVSCQNKCAEWLISQGADINFTRLGENTLHACAGADNYEFVKKYWSEIKHNISKGNKLGLTPLHVAAKSSSSKVLKIILDSFELEELVDIVNKADTSENTVLHYAVEAGHLESMKMLLSIPGVNINVKNKYGISLLKYSVMYGTPDIIQMALDHGLDNENFDSLLSIPLMWGKEETVKFLLKLPNITVENKKEGYFQNTLLHEALKSHNIANTAEFLISFPNVDINVKNIEGATVLMFAALYCTPAVIEMLVRRSADLDEVDNQGRTVLHYALLANKPKNLQYLLSLPKINLNSNANQNLVFYAAQNNTPQILKILLDHGVNVKGVNTDGETVLMVALKANKTDNAKLLIATPGADIHATNNNGMTALMYAARYTTQEILEILVDKGVDVNQQDEDGNTALYHTLHKDDRAYDGKMNNRLKYLLSLPNLDLMSKNKKDRTVLMEAALPFNPKSLHLLLQNGAEITEDRDVNGRTIFHLAPHVGDCSSWKMGIDVIKILMFYSNVDINMKNSEGQSVVEYVKNKINDHDALLNLIDDGLTILDSDETVLIQSAARSGDFRLINYLIKNGMFDVFDKSSTNMTVLHQAAWSGDEDILKIILEQITKQCANAKKVYELLNAKDDLGNTPLHWAAASGKYNIFENLLQNLLVDCNVSNNMGETALHMAIKRGLLGKPFKNPNERSHYSLGHVRSLLRVGADADIKDKKGRTVLDIAKSELMANPEDKVLQCIIKSLENKPVYEEEEDDLAFGLFD